MLNKDKQYRFRKAARSVYSDKVRIKELTQQIEEVEYILRGVHAVDTSKEIRGGYNQSDIKHKLYEKKDRLLEAKNAYKARVKWVYNNIEKCDRVYRPIIVAIYLIEESPEAIANSIGISRQKMYEKLSVVLEKGISEKSISKLDSIEKKISTIEDNKKKR